MKRLILVLMTLIAGGFLFAAEKIVYKDYELDSLLYSIDQPGQPLVTDEYIIFTSEPNYRFIGIAFDFENYQTIHPFQILTQKDADDESKIYRKNMFYVYNRQHKFTKLKYRLIIDGLWTTDPLNPNREYDDNMNLYFSVVEDPDSIKISTSESKDDTVHFIYKGESGQKVHLSGTFTNWDPWIYQLKETKPGFYELELPLTTGKYFYTYYIGLTPVLDSSNPEKIYTADGRAANVIIVD